MDVAGTGASHTDYAELLAARLRSLKKPSFPESIFNTSLSCPGTANNTSRIIKRPSDANVTYSPTGEFWQMNKRGRNEIYLISAFYDDRPPVGRKPFVRLLAVSTPPMETVLFCFVWFKGTNRPFVTHVKTHSSGRGDTILGVRYYQYLYSCSLPTDAVVPTHVSVSYTRCAVGRTYLPIVVPDSMPQHKFGVCVAIAFGSIDSQTFVEWIEFNRLLGVTEFNVYNASLSDDVTAVFGYYEELGVLRVHQMPPPVPDYSKRGAKLGSPASLNDCMLRNAYRFRHMVVIDFDEIIVPKQHDNYSAMLRHIDKRRGVKQPCISYTFRNEYYFLDYKADESQQSHMRSLRYRRHGKPDRFLFAPKSFINPRECLSVFNHYCWIRFPDASQQFTLDVDMSIATSRHFRRCGFGANKCQQYNASAELDNSVLRFKAKLERRVTTALDSLRQLNVTNNSAQIGDVNTIYGLVKKTKM